MRDGKFVVIEGLDFTGKTTLALRISKFFESKKIDHIITREPGGTSLGESIRTIILSSKDDNICKESILLLFLAARAEHISKVINPALEKGKVVICDRFLASTLVYQGLLYGGFKQDEILNAHDTFNYGLYPDLTLILDADTEILERRRASKNSQRKNNKYDFLPKDTVLKLKSAFIEISKLPSLKAKTIDSSSSSDATFEKAKDLILNLWNI
jgi:dTMP kinase